MIGLFDWARSDLTGRSRFDYARSNLTCISIAERSRRITCHRYHAWKCVYLFEEVVSGDMTFSLSSSSTSPSTSQLFSYI